MWHGSVSVCSWLHSRGNIKLSGWLGSCGGCSNILIKYERKSKREGLLEFKDQTIN